MKKELLEKYISESEFKGWSPDRGFEEIYDEIVDFMEEKLADYEILADAANDIDSKGRKARAELKRTFDILDRSWESTKKALSQMTLKFDKYSFGLNDPKVMRKGPE